MKAFQIFLLLFFVAVSIGCGAMGEKRRSGEQITVVIGPALLERPEKVEEILENQGVEHLYNYLQNYIRDGGGLRESIKVHVTITELRVGWGRDMMGIDVYAAEKGEELKRFHLVDTTSRSKPVKRLAKALAKKTYNEIQEL
ncbi:hypothetical protein [Kaarinaea lacus]